MQVLLHSILCETSCMRTGGIDLTSLVRMLFGKEFKYFDSDLHRVDYTHLYPWSPVSFCCLSSRQHFTRVIRK